MSVDEFQTQLKRLKEWVKTYPRNYISVIDDAGRDDSIIQGIVFYPLSDQSPLVITELVSKDEDQVVFFIPIR